MIKLSSLTSFDPANASIEGHSTVEIRLSQLRGVFADDVAYNATLSEGVDPVVYSVTSVKPADGDGQLHYGIGKIMPGRVGQEYFMTRGHFHEWRIAAEIYIGLSGTGLMLLEDENGVAVRSIELCKNSVVYVPGHTAHRTINSGDEPLTYMGVYPAKAGHDYGELAIRNFSKVVVVHDGGPVLTERREFLDILAQSQGK